jgi:signal transduction histidine kinase
LSLTTSPSVAFAVHPGVRPGVRPLVSNTSAPETPRFRSAERVEVAGQPWPMEILSVQPDDGDLPFEVRGSLAAGLLISLMVFAVTRAQAAAWAAQARHASELQEYATALGQTDAELRRAVALEREARALAQTADRAKDEFLARLSHELRTPLNAILGWTSMLRQGVGARRGDALEIIARNAQLQAQLVDDLLDVSRITAGTLRLNRSVVTLVPIVDAAVESLRPVANAKRMDLVVNVPAGDFPIYADSTRVQQIVSNVLANAIKFTPDGGQVFLHVTRDAGDVMLRVRDTGIGITPDFLPHVFEPFRQADSSTTRAYNGAGLGLAIVRHLVEVHDGTIDVQSDGPNQGALFTVRLPLAEGASTAPGPGVAA